jgi:PAS domain S-box-containing protein
MMPNLDGFGLLRKLRSDKRTATIPVILVSARAGEESRVEGVAAGADDYLSKPFSARELTARVDTHLKLARIRREASERESKLRVEAERNEWKFRAIVETTPECVMLVGPDGNVLHMNGPGLAMVGADCAEMVVGRNVYDLIAPEDRERFREFNHRICGGEKGSLEFDIVGLRGARRHMETHAAPLRQPDGSFMQLAVTRDISERKRAEEALRQSEGRLAAEADALAKLNDWSSRLWRIRDLKEGLHTVLAGVMELLGANKGNVQLFDAERGVLTAEVQPGFDPESLDLFREVSADDDCACGRALRTGEPVVIEDVETDALFAPFRSAARAAGFRAMISAPIMGNDGRPVGMLSTHFASVHRPTKQDLRRLELYVRHAAEFIQRCKTEEVLRQSEDRFRALSERLDSEVRARTRELEERNADVLRQSDQLRELSWQLLRTQDEERRHIARELHDSAGQMLAVLAINLGTLVESAKQKAPEIAESAKESHELVQQLTKEIRTTSYLLHPPLLDENGLPAALSWYIRGLAERSGLEIAFNISQEFGRLPREMELVVFRLVQECLTNIHRHSGSKSAVIQIDREIDRVSVAVRDRGRGISPEKLAEIQSGGSGVGIRGIRERLRQFRGQMRFDSTSAGTTVTVTIPIAPEGQASCPGPARTLEPAV